MKKLLGLFIASFYLSIFAIGISSAAKITDDLVGYWPLDGDVKDTIAGLGGKLADGAKWTDKGKIKKAVEVDGVTGHVLIDDFELKTDTITSVAWINGWRQTAWTGIVVGRGTTPFWMGFTDQDTLSYVWNNDSDKTWGWINGPKIPQDEWALAAIAIEPTKATGYIYTDAGGLKQEANNLDHIEQTVTNLKFGWDECCGDNRHVAGILDEVMIYNRPLAEDEILKIATSGLAVEFKDKLATQWGTIKQQ